MSIIPSEAMDIVSKLAEHPISLSLHVSGLTLLLVDWLSTLSVEIIYMWKGSWNMGRVFYFVTRYTALLGTPLWLYCNMAFGVPPSLCSRLYVICSALAIFGIIVAELILTVRVYAIWGRRRSIGILLATMTVLNLAANFTISNLLRVRLHYFTIPNLPGCLSFAVKPAGSHSWPFIPIIIHQTLIFSLTAIKAVEHYRDKVYGTSLVDAFYRDGTVYYVTLVAFSLGNLATAHERFDMTTKYFLSFLQLVVHSILSSRMLLHLRRESVFHVNSEGSTSMDFATVERPATSRPSIIVTQTRSRLSGISEIPSRGWLGQEDDSAVSEQPKASGSKLPDSV